jgi:hypothetical protein
MNDLMILSKEIEGKIETVVQEQKTIASKRYGLCPNSPESIKLVRQWDLLEGMKIAFDIVNTDILTDYIS